MTRLYHKRILVIGAGLGGLSAAISLAAVGYSVELHEKNTRIGGKLDRLERDGFVFDLGPSILTLPHYFRRLWELAGRRMDDEVTLLPVRPHWRNFFEDGMALDLDPDPHRLAQECAKVGDPALARRLRKFLEYSGRQYDRLAPGYFEHGLDTAADLFRYHFWPDFVRLDYAHSVHGAVRRRIREPHFTDIFDYFCKYVGSSPWRAPGFMNLLPTIQFRYDLWYVAKGMYHLALALNRLAIALGVDIRLNSEIVRIETKEGRARGALTAQGERRPADAVICNMEVIPAYEKLLSADSRSLRRLNKFEPSCSGLVCHLGIDRQYPQLAHHNFFYSRDPKTHFRSVFERGELPEDPTLYVVAAARSDPTIAPAGCENLKVLCHIPHLNPRRLFNPSEYQALKERILAKLERIGLTDLRRHIVTEDCRTPHDIQGCYYSNQGAIYGVVSDRSKNFALKAPKRSTLYRDLYFVGGSVNPGGGMPMAVLGGLHAARMIVADSR